ncbi:Protein of unknown function [Gryllus bimaculatus]|nr:Protein of unknown function [Gryllus bimaculatus]
MRVYKVLLGKAINREKGINVGYEWLCNKYRTAEEHVSPSRSPFAAAVTMVFNRPVVVAALVLLAVTAHAAAVGDAESAGEGRSLRVRRDACDATGWEWLNDAACATKCRLDGYKDSKCLLGKCVCYSLPAIE